MKPKKEKEARETHITVRLSLAERAAIDAAAERAGLMNGSYIRSRLIDGPIPRQVRRPPVERRELARLLGELGKIAGDLGKIGSNLNQIARAVNTGVVPDNSVLPEALRDFRKTLAGLLDMRAAVLTALGREP